MVDALVSIAVEKLNTILQDEVALLVGVANEIEKLSSTFTLIQAVLKDAETRRVKDEPVKVWMEKLKDVAYDVDDILDEWTTEALRSQESDEGDSSCFSFLVTCFLCPVTCFHHVKLRHKMGSRIKEVRGRLDDIEKEKNQLGLRVDSGERERVETEVRREVIRERETSSSLDRPSVVGREDDKNEVLDLLLRERSGEVNEVSVVISIVGMGGLGKTTLAQLIYNDEKVKEHFEMRMWVCVSEDFDVTQITKSIIESATKSRCKHLRLDLLQSRLYEMLHAKQFLLVLDDIWSDDSEKWDKLSLPFQAGAPGSRIIITTRNEKVALAMGRAQIHNLAVLSDDDCWLLFRRRALEHRSAEECSGLEDIGREIVRKCGGVPLAAKTIGSAMCSRRTRRQWELVLRSEIWMSGDVLGHVLPALLLSYHDLPPALKQCFTYCSVFPKDWEIEKDVIVKLWVAQGFIRSDRSEDMEEIGGLYFDDLLRRSLLQDAVLDDHKNILKCKMHDLVHDLAQYVAGSDYSLVETGKQALLNLNSVRHCFSPQSFESGDESDGDEVASIWAPLYKAQKLRTLLCSLTYYSPVKAPNNLFLQLRCLRALDLSGTYVKKLPQTVGQLIHLRYLDLTRSHIRELPEEVSNCINLQTLRLNGCEYLKKLPKGLRKMISLRHLEFALVDKLGYLPQGIGRLTDLQTLTEFFVGGDKEGCKCGELKHLNHLQGRLRITGVKNVRSRNEAMEAELNKKQHLQSLVFSYDDEASDDDVDDEASDDDVDDEASDDDDVVNRTDHIDVDDEASDDDDVVNRTEDVLEILQPHENLKELYIKDYGGSKLPRWIQDPVFFNLVKVTLWACRKCEQLPGLGKLPSLKYLEIWAIEEVRKVGVEFSGDDNNDGIVGGGGVSFPKLETLEFSFMPNWEEWELRGGDGQVMPSLHQLEVGWCPKLKELPSNLPPLLKKLTLKGSDVGMSSGGIIPVLPNLNHLGIWSTELTSIPGGWLGQLKALQTLEFMECPNLRSLPEELRHLTRLQHLKISGCPFLEERCGGGGEDRYKITHIPNISIF